MTFEEWFENWIKHNFCSDFFDGGGPAISKKHFRQYCQQAWQSGYNSCDSEEDTTFEVYSDEIQDIIDD